MGKDDEVDPSQNELDALELLGQSILELGTAIPRIYPEHYEQFQQTTRVMKQALQHTLETSVKIYTRLKYDQGTTQLSITIHNKSIAIPVKLSIGTLDFKSVNHASDPVTEPQPKLPSLQTTDPSTSLFLSPTTTIPLLPNSKYNETLKITTIRPIQYNGYIQIQVSPLDCPNPTPIPIKHSFGLYLIDQMKKSMISTLHPLHPQEEGYEWSYQAQFLQDTFELDPVIAQGMLICLASSEEKIICRIDSMAKDDNVQVSFFGENKDFIRSLVHELDSLDI